MGMGRNCYYWKKVYTSFGYIAAFFMLCGSYGPSRAAVDCTGTGTWQQLLGLNSTLISRAYLHTDYMDLDVSDYKWSNTHTPTPNLTTTTVTVARLVFVEHNHSWTPADYLLDSSGDGISLRTKVPEQ